MNDYNNICVKNGHTFSNFWQWRIDTLTHSNMSELCGPSFEKRKNFRKSGAVLAWKFHYSPALSWKTSHVHLTYLRTISAPTRDNIYKFLPKWFFSEITNNNFDPFLFLSSNSCSISKTTYFSKHFNSPLYKLTAQLFPVPVLNTTVVNINKIMGKNRERKSQNVSLDRWFCSSIHTSQRTELLFTNESLLAQFFCLSPLILLCVVFFLLNSIITTDL